MNRNKDPRYAEIIERMAAVWLVKSERRSDPESSRALATWLDENPRHRAAYLRVSAAWKRADVLKRLADPTRAPDPDLLLRAYLDENAVPKDKDRDDDDD